MTRSAKRKELEVRARRWDAEAMRELCLYDAERQGRTASWRVVKEAFGWQIMINGFYFMAPHKTRKGAVGARREALESGDLSRQLTNWAAVFRGRRRPLWWGRDAHWRI